MQDTVDGYQYVEKLPYTSSALEPFISRETVELHYDVHHKGYEKRMQLLLKDEKDKWSLESILDYCYQRIKISDPAYDFAAIYNNAAQVANHNIFWQSLSPNSKGLSGDLLNKIVETFNSVEQFKQEFISSSVGVFGSGWAWLIMTRERNLEIVTTSPAYNPINTRPGCRVLLGIDLWEHSYYLDYRQDRAKYVTNLLDNLVDWDRACEIYRQPGNQSW